MSRRRTDDEFLAADDEILYDSDGQIEEDRSDSGREGYSSDEQTINRIRRNRNHEAQKRTMQTRDKGKGKGKAWEGQFERTWDQVQEDERGTLEGAVSDMLLTSKTRR